MNALIKIFVVVFIVFMAGCSQQYWYKEDVSFEQCKLDRNECFDELKKHSDLNYIRSYEVRFMEDCMHSRGYIEVEEKDLPMDVRREAPSQRLYWKQKGIAGSVD